MFALVPTTHELDKFLGILLSKGSTASSSARTPDLHPQGLGFLRPALEHHTAT
jgi:hypothetical protein